MDGVHRGGLDRCLDSFHKSGFCIHVDEAAVVHKPETGPWFWKRPYARREIRSWNGRGQHSSEPTRPAPEPYSTSAPGTEPRGFLHANILATSYAPRFEEDGGFYDRAATFSEGSRGHRAWQRSNW